MRETEKNSKNAVGEKNDEAIENPPNISMQDLLSSFGKMKESKMHTGMLNNGMDNRIDLD